MTCIKTCGLVAANGTAIMAKLESTTSANTAVIRLHQRTDSHRSHGGGFSLLAAVFSPSVRQNDGGIRSFVGWMSNSGNCSSVNKSKADLDYVSFNEQSAERGRGSEGGGG